MPSAIDAMTSKLTFLPVLLVLIGCAQKTPMPVPDLAADARSLHTVMQDHFVYIDHLQKAVIAGDLAQAKLSAQWILDNHVKRSNPSWDVHLDRLEAAATHVTAAPDLAQASIGAARVAGACGSCHEAHGIDLKLSAPPIAKEEPGTRAHMKRHQWATDRLWDAVVGNSDSVWNEAALALSDAPLQISDDAGDPPDDDVVDVLQTAAKVVHDVGQNAQSLKERKDRVAALGELLSTCATCHGALGIEPQNR